MQKLNAIQQKCAENGFNFGNVIKCFWMRICLNSYIEKIVGVQQWSYMDFIVGVIERMRNEESKKKKKNQENGRKMVILVMKCYK